MMLIWEIENVSKSKSNLVEKAMMFVSKKTMGSVNLVETEIASVAPPSLIVT